MLHSITIIAGIAIFMAYLLIAGIKTLAITVSWATIGAMRILLSICIGFGLMVLSPKLRYYGFKAIKNMYMVCYTTIKMLLHLLLAIGNGVRALVVVSVYWLIILGKYGTLLIIGLSIQGLLLVVMGLLKGMRRSGIISIKTIILTQKIIITMIKNAHHLPKVAKQTYKKSIQRAQGQYTRIRHPHKRQKQRKEESSFIESNRYSQQKWKSIRNSITAPYHGVKALMETLKSLIIMIALLMKALWITIKWATYKQQRRRIIKGMLKGGVILIKKSIKAILIVIAIGLQILWGFAKLLATITVEMLKALKMMLKHWVVTGVLIASGGIIALGSINLVNNGDEFLSHMSEAEVKGLAKYAQLLRVISIHSKALGAKGRKYEVMVSTVGQRISIESLLKAENVAQAEIDAVLSSLKKEKKSLISPQNTTVRMELENNREGISLIKMVVPTSITTAMTIERKKDSTYTIGSEEKEVKRYIQKRIAKIETNLSQTAIGSGIPQSVIATLTNLFAWDIDFQRDIRMGDNLEVLFECDYTSEEELVSCGNILYAALVVQGKNFKVYAYEYDGSMRYFSPEGNSVEKSLLKTPVEGAKLTSGYGARTHPVLGFTAHHKGVDFSAPIGTKVFAAGDGVIVRMDWSPSYGNVVKIRHNSEYSTLYAHLNGFASGLKVGAKVRRQQIIAYTGATGRVTGPHLHYEVLHNDNYVNPMTLKFQSEFSLSSTELLDYQQKRATIETLFSRTPTKGKVYMENPIINR